MGKTKPYSRRELNILRREWLKRNHGIVAWLVAGTFILLTVELGTIVLLWRSNDSVKWYVLGVLQAGTVAAALHLLSSSFLAHERDAIVQLRGAWGEENTRTELQRAKRKRLIWGWVDSVSLAAGDIDHLVVTRSGGLVAIDTKWRSQTDARDQALMARAAQKVKLRSEGLIRSLVERQPGSHRARSNPLQVTPLVVVWGALQRHVPSDARIDGVDFIGGRQLLDWIASHTDNPVSKEAARDLLQRVESFRTG